METIWSVDRISGDTAVLEGPERAMRTVALSQLPPGAREGDCLRETEGAYVPDEAETARRRAYNRELFRRLREN